jgi:hypothetical protein
VSINLGRRLKERLSLGVKAVSVRKDPGLRGGGNRADIKNEVKVMGRLDR